MCLTATNYIINSLEVVKVAQSSDDNIKWIPLGLMGWALTCCFGIRHHHQQSVARVFQELTPWSQNKIPYCNVMKLAPAATQHTFTSKFCSSKFILSYIIWKTCLNIDDNGEISFFRRNLHRHQKEKVHLSAKASTKIKYKIK